MTRNLILLVHMNLCLPRRPGFVEEIDAHGLQHGKVTAEISLLTMHVSTTPLIPLRRPTRSCCRWCAATWWWACYRLVVTLMLRCIFPASQYYHPLPASQYYHPLPVSQYLNLKTMHWDQITESLLLASSHEVVIRKCLKHLVRRPVWSECQTR